MADWHQSVMFHMMPLVTISEMTGDMPDTTRARDADSVQEAGEGRPRQPELTVHAPRSVRDCIQALMQDQVLDVQSDALRCLSMSNLYFIILGMLTEVVQDYQDR